MGVLLCQVGIFVIKRVPFKDLNSRLSLPLFAGGPIDCGKVDCKTMLVTAPFDTRQHGQYIGVAGSVGVGFDLKAATEQLQLRTNELHQGPDTKNKCKFGEWAF